MTVRNSGNPPLTERLAESREVEVMCALDLLLDVAYHDGAERDLAIAAEAYTLAGYSDGMIMVSHASADETLRRIAKARKGRAKRILTIEARGLLQAVETLASEGMLHGRDTRERKNARWQERGGHSRV